MELLSFTFNGTQIPRAVFWLPKPRVPDTTSIHFPDFLTLGDTKTVFHSLVPRVLSYPSLRKSGNEVACFIFIGITFSTNKNLSLIILTVLFCRGKQINVHEAKYTELVETWYSPCSILSKISKISRLAIFFFSLDALHTNTSSDALFDLIGYSFVDRRIQNMLIHVFKTTNNYPP